MTRDQSGDAIKPLTSKSPDTYLCDECVSGFESMQEPSYCPYCGEELDD